MPCTEIDTVTQACAARHLGLSKRERFAVAALQGLLANPLAADSSRDRLVEGAVQYADALLEELAK